MEYLVVIATHDGEWHCIGGGDWRRALAMFGAAVTTLVTVDYYEDVPPTAAKIIWGHEKDYASARAIASPGGDEE